jgi:hypothetical protein
VSESKEKPYLGLIPYSEGDAEYFFGRDREQKVITANLMASRLTLLYGASGVGKSSVLRAGVSRGLQLLAVENIKELGTPEYIGVGFSSWRDNPTAGLLTRVEESIAAILQEDHVGPLFDDDDADDNNDGPRTLAQLLHDRAFAADATLLITLDQFEEYFLYAPQHTEERSFASELAQAINTPDLDANFLISIREDALTKLDSFREQIPNLFDNYLRIDHLDYKSAREAIEEPIKKYNSRHSGGQPYRIEPALVNDVLEQIQTGHLLLEGLGHGIIADKSKETRVETPYLQVVMTRLWDQTVAAGSRTLARSTLLDLGGSKKIIETHLDAAMSALSEDEQGIAARVFKYLVTPSGTKIAHTASDLAAYSKRQVSEILPMLEKLAAGDARVLRTVPPPPDRPNADHRYEIFHDVLASAILAWQAQLEQKQKNAEAEKIASKNLERALDELNESERDIAVNIFNGLITSSGTRAALTIDQLAYFVRLPPDAVRKVVTRLSVADEEIVRLVEPAASSSDSAAYYEISNEILVKPIGEWCESRRAKRRTESPGNNAEEATYVGSGAAILLKLYFIVLMILAIYGIYIFWRKGAPDPSTPAVARDVKYLFWTFSVSLKTRLAAIAFFSGLLGSAGSALYLFATYVKQRVLVRARLVQYAVMPLIGLLIGLVILVLLQIGFLDKLAASATEHPAGLVGFALYGGIVGSPYLLLAIKKFEAKS